MAKENYFDFRQRVSARPTEGVRARTTAPEPLTVSQLTSQIERVLKAGIPNTVHVKGEASNCKLHRASGHVYFTLKDAAACIDCVMFRSDAARLKFVPEDGIELLVSGRLGVYPQRGRYQLYVTALSPMGRGALELAFQQLCARLQKEGLFEVDRKKPLPSYPSTIALVTSRSTAALQDLLKVLRRFPWIRLLLFDVPVQGDGAAELIADALRELNRNAKEIGGIDLILLARGGGSLEDLWEFNEEIVARAIAGSRIPVITGIGHEVDVSIADLVADYHAHTPTEAAQTATTQWKLGAERTKMAAARLWRGLHMIVQDSRQRLRGIIRHEFFRRPTDRVNQLRQLLDDRQRAIQLAMGERLRVATSRLSRLEAMFVDCHPRHVLELKRQRMAEMSQRMRISIKARVHSDTQRVVALERQLRAISPQAVLSRGYTITTRKKSGAVVRSSKEPRIGERLVTQFADGTVESSVEDQKQLPLFD